MALLGALLFSGCTVWVQPQAKVVDLQFYLSSQVLLTEKSMPGERTPPLEHWDRNTTNRRLYRNRKGFLFHPLGQNLKIMYN